jgi:hypothetical protein
MVLGTDGGLAVSGVVSATGVANSGNLTLTSGSNSWILDTTGNLTVPGSIILPPNTLITSTAASPAPRLSGFDSVSAVNVSASGNITSTLVSATGNITGGNLLFGSGIVSGTGNITGKNLTAAATNGTLVLGDATASNIPGLSSTSSITFVTARGGTEKQMLFGVDGSLAVPNTVSATGNITSTANVTGGNLTTGGLISATSSANALNLITRNGDSNPVNSKTQIAMGYNGTTDYSQFIHTRHNGGSSLYNTIELWTSDGTQAGTFPANAILGLTVMGGKVAVGNSIINPGNVLDVGGNVYATGNIAGGNITTAGLISATGNITATANITGGNLTTGGLITATGNVTGGNLITGGLVSATGNITATGNISGGNLTITGNTATITSANYQIGYLNIPQISLAANATTALTDAGKHFYSVSAANLQLTIANNTSVVWPVGTAMTIVNRGTANVLIVPGTGVSLYLAGNSTSANRVVTTYGMATVINVAANIWMINGTVV